MVADECSTLHPRPFLFIIQERYSTLKPDPKNYSSVLSIKKSLDNSKNGGFQRKYVFLT